MTDFHIILILIFVVAALVGYVALVERVPLMSVLDIGTALAALFGFIYLLWALLRPEDF